MDTDWPFQGPPRPEEASFEGDAAYESGIAAVGQRVGSKLCGSPAAATSLVSPGSASGFFTIVPPRKPHIHAYIHTKKGMFGSECSG